nr:12636_t:CDS:10 [Entrophospora candida]
MGKKTLKKLGSFIKKPQFEHDNHENTRKQKHLSITSSCNSYNYYTSLKSFNLSINSSSTSLTSITTPTSIKSLSYSAFSSLTFDDLPVEIIIKIFDFLIEPTDCLRVWRDNYYSENNNYDNDISPNHFNNEILFSRDQWFAAENQRRILRLTCKTWNSILLGLLTQMEIDLYRTKKYELENCVLRPRNLQKLSIYDTGFSNNNPILGTGIDQWLSQNVSQLQSLSLKDCHDLTINGLLNLPSILTELKIINCSQIIPELIIVLKGLSNLNHLTLNTNRFFVDPSFSKDIEKTLPNLTSLHIIIPCSTKFGTDHSYDIDNITRVISDDMIIIKQCIPPNSFPNHIKELILSQDLPQKKHRILTKNDYEQMGPDDGLPLRVKHVLVLNDPNAYPSSLKRLDVSKCFFDNNLFALPSDRTTSLSPLTHLTASYPSLPRDYDTISLPSTLEYLNVTGFVYHAAYESDSHYTYHAYGRKWIDLLPKNAPSLHTLILHLYTYDPENLYSIIKSRYSKSLRKLDISICYSGITGFENDDCLCEKKCFQAQCYRRQMIRSLSNLNELRLHNTIYDGDLDQLPDSLKYFQKPKMPNSSKSLSSSSTATIKIPTNLKPSDPQGSELLEQERSRATFNVQDLTLVIYGRRDLERFDRILKILENDPDLDKSNIYFLGRTELFERSLRTEKKLVKLSKENKWSPEEIQIAIFLIDLAGPFGVHRSMFIPTLIGQGNEEQKKKFLHQALDYKIIGCYAQTELGHGSNVQGLETTATYIPETDEFEIHSPYLTAPKWWVGGLGRAANHAIVMAILITNGKSFGPHPFVVQIRDLETHQPLPGITIGDIGPKFGYNSMDNGFMLFDKVRIPRFNMLSKYSWVEKGTGVYKSPPNNKLSYGTMVLVRSVIVTGVYLAMARAATIAVRYSAIRRQFVDKDNPKRLKDGRIVETSVLDYTMQQYRLFPVVAQAFACYFTAKALLNLHHKYTAQSSDGDFSLLADLHASSSGLKSLTSTMAVDAIEDCRRACGGHGYSSFSGFSKFYQDYLPNTTWEGDNYILTQQTARFLLKSYRDLVNGKVINGYGNPSEYLLDYLNNPTDKCQATESNHFLDHATQLKIFGHRAAHLISKTIDKLDNRNASWNSSLVEISKISKAHCQYLLVRNFTGALGDGSRLGDEEQRILSASPNLKNVLTSLCNLFSLHTIIEKESGEFLESGYLSIRQVELIREEIYNLLREIRPNIVGLVDSFHLSDYLLNSALGRSDGKVYETMINWAVKEPLNNITFDIDPNSTNSFKGIKSKI